MLNLSNHKISGILFINVFKKILCNNDLTKNIYCFSPRALRNIKLFALNNLQTPEGNSGVVTCMLAWITNENIKTPERVSLITLYYVLHY